VGEVAALLPPPGSLLEERVLPFSIAEVTSLKVSYAGVQIELTRDGDVWLSNGEPTANAQTQAVDLLTLLIGDRAHVLGPGQPGGDYLEATAGAVSLRVELGEATDGGRVAWSPGEPGFLLATDSLVMLENVVLGSPPAE
jgi:hypothetical protein